MNMAEGSSHNDGRLSMINVTMLHSSGERTESSDHDLARLGTFAVAIAGLMTLLALAL
jgi:hypothetical protein